MNIIKKEKTLLLALSLLLLMITPFCLSHQQHLVGQKPPYRFFNMRLERDSKIYAVVGDRLISVGQMTRGNKLQALAVSNPYVALRFGHSVGLIRQENLTELKPAVVMNKVERQAAVPQNLLTYQQVTIYSAATRQSQPLATLAANLRYPLQRQQQDHLKQTWYVVYLGGHQGYINARDVELDNGIPVLTYHHILTDSENKKFQHTSTTTSDVSFSHQMDYLKQEGYATLSLYQLEGYLKGTINLPARAVVLTFDDGLKSVYRYAYPILKRHGQRATAFIISSRIKHAPQTWNPDELQFMSLTELRQIQDVFDIQSHSHFLHRLDSDEKPILFDRSYHVIQLDFAHSRRALMQLNPYLQCLSYPYGGFNQTAISAAQAAGFTLAVTTLPGKVKLGDNPLALKRLYILRTDSLSHMEQLINNNNMADDSLLYNQMRKIKVTQ